MDLQIKGHAAIVQGASKGIGRGIAESLAMEGCDLIITARNQEPLEQAAREIAAASGRRIVAQALDTSDSGAMERLAQRAWEEFARLDILVCNSGGPPAGTIKDLELDQWRNAAELLLVSPVALLKSALPLMTKSPAPRLFVVTSSSTRQPVAGLTLSNTMRPGVMGLIRSLSDELGADGVRCHSIAPGRFATERLDHVINMQAEKAGRTAEETRDGMVASIPAGRLGKPVDIGNLVAFLSSPQADYLTGGNWLVDGGLVRLVG